MHRYRQRQGFIEHRCSHRPAGLAAPSAGFAGAILLLLLGEA
jgi:hypothetical protein